MSIILLAISGILFITTFGVHVMILNLDKYRQPMYIHKPVFAAIPWIAGFILPVIPFMLIFQISFWIILLINIAVVSICGPMFTRAFLSRFASGKSLAKDMVTSFTLGVVLLIIGLATR